MKQEFFNLKINTAGQKLYEFTDQTIQWINKNNFKNGILNLSIQHTSASLIVQENADPDVQTDLINYFDKLAPMDEKLYIHNTEGKDESKWIEADNVGFKYNRLVMFNPFLWHSNGDWFGTTYDNSRLVQLFFFHGT